MQKQSERSILPSAEVMLPYTHGKHAVPALAFRYVPVGQEPQLDTASELLNVPGEHAVQLVRAALSSYPAEQLRHAVPPLALIYVPPGQN